MSFRNGVFVTEVAEIAGEYPTWTFRIVPIQATADTKARKDVEINGPEDEQGHLQEITDRINAAIIKFDKLPGVPGVSGSIEMTVGKRKKAEE